MYDDAAGGFVCRQDQLVRHVGVLSGVPPLAVDPPLRVLGIVSFPTDLTSLDVATEQSQLAGILDQVVGGRAELTWAPAATWTSLQDILLRESWHIVHFIGHEGFDPRRDEGVLGLTDKRGRAVMVEASRLVSLLREARPMPRLVVLNSCSGATASTANLFSNTAASLVRGGIRAVTAMQYQISDTAAAAFARGFYSALARGRGIDEAVSSGRVAIIGLGGRTLEWITPVLYQSGHSSRLFILQNAAAVEGPERSAMAWATGLRGTA
jgi:CHAT domain